MNHEQEKELLQYLLAAGIVHLPARVRPTYTFYILKTLEKYLTEGGQTLLNEAIIDLPGEVKLPDISPN